MFVFTYFSFASLSHGLRAICLLAIGLLAAAISTAVNAWGTDGHHAVANLAEVRLTPAARKEVTRLLALEPGATLASISTYADENRTKGTGPWHYVNLPRDSCTFQPERDCPNGQCVVAAIDAQAKVLASGAPDADRLLALKYVVHFVADIHQPLHAGFADDRGANTYQLQAFGRGTNLHALWDSGLLEGTGRNAASLTQSLAGAPPNLLGRRVSAAQVAEESCKIVAEPGFYPDRKLSSDYVTKYLPVVEQQLRLAGERLAQVLNEALR